MSIIAQKSDNSIAKSIYEKRIRLNMTQKELADAVGMPKYGDRTIRRWENGESCPSALELKCILDFPEDIPFPSNPNADYKIIDLFAGIGGTRLGFHLTGRTKSVFSSEIDKFAVKTYRANFNDTPYGDITKIKNLEAYLADNHLQMSVRYGTPRSSHRYYVMESSGERFLFGYDSEEHHPEPVFSASLKPNRK